ncbi:MAG: AAA family ATPase [Myxococcales bacterium]|jgi:hypothetical protein
MNARDSRLEAFCDKALPEVFSSVCHRHEIFRDDPFDVEAIHANARSVFARMLHRATTPPGLASGRILLLKGEAGSGKTHLMRAFRRQLHESGLGYFGYLQMTTWTERYDQYLLDNLILSLDQPYRDGSGVSGLMRLSTALLQSDGMPDGAQAQLLEAAEGPDISARIAELADGLISSAPRFAALDVDLVRALLYLQRGDPRIDKRVQAWLRCEDLDHHGRSHIGGLVPRLRDDDPQRMVEQLARAMWTLQGAALVVCVDQLEDLFQGERMRERFQAAMSTLCALADRIPSSIFVVSCLADYYDALSPSLRGSTRDRLERDPEPIILESNREPEEIRQLVIARLRYLYEQLDAPFYDVPGDPIKHPLYPFRPAGIADWAGLRTRDVLDNCRAVREHAQRTGQLPEVNPTNESSNERSNSKPTDGAAITEIEQRWNDFVSSFRTPPPDDEPGLASVLARAIERASLELESGHAFRARAQGRLVEVDVLGPHGQVLGRQLIGLCNAAAQGGKLGRQIEEVAARAKERTPVLVRSTSYPSNPKTQVVKLIGQVIDQGGRRAVVGEADWRTMIAMEAFRGREAHTPSFGRWLGEENPLSRLLGLQEVLGLDRLPRVPETPAKDDSRKEEKRPNAALAPPTPAPEAPPRESPRPMPSTTALRVGRQTGLVSRELTIEPAELTQHAAFLGGSGSGKTTLALALIEQLLARGIPAILLDRKGDLCAYANPAAWAADPRDEQHRVEREALRERLDVALFTPGSVGGRPVSIALAPPDLGKLPEHEREQVASHAACALGSMLGYKDSCRDKACIALLAHAIRLLAELDHPVTFDNLLKVIGDKEPTLVAAIGYLDKSNFTRLASDLETLKVTRGTLVRSRAPSLDIDELLGRGPHAVPGKTRLSIINTKFLGEERGVLFFVAQLLVGLARWASKNPAATLQAALLADEADLYLPATSKPPTKEPMENLLKRARSAGLSIMLATQSPGDLDYRCRDTIRSWFVGRVKEQTALAKMKPMLADCRTEVTGRIPSQGTGDFHLLQEGAAIAFHAHESLVRAVQVPEEEIRELAARTSVRSAVA